MAIWVPLVLLSRVWVHSARAMEGIEIVAYAEDTDPSGLEDASTYYPDANIYTDYEN
ncbi:MAG: hypothetical protein CM1200mP37_9040 [Chloroflexota bacterium]|nr:MAG: hypothetical protein CM1200mP37_9040 [Chloroflexota bacterium]